MNPYDYWHKALRHTEIIRSRVKSLMVFQETMVPYIFLCASSVNEGDTVVRTGCIKVERPSLILPPDIPQLEGFEFQEREGEDEHSVFNFLLVRGIHLPSLRYNHTTHSLEIFEGSLSKAVDVYQNRLARAEDVQTGLITGAEDCWQFSLLIYMSSQIARNAESDIRQLLKEYHDKKRP